MDEALPPMPPPRTTLWARLLNVFATPGAVFDEVVAEAHPTPVNWIVPLVFAAVVGIIFSLVVFSQPSVIQQLKERQQTSIQKLVDAGKLTEEQGAERAKQIERFFNPTVLKIASALGSMAANAFWMFGIGLGLWLLGKFIFKREFPFMLGVEVTGLSFMIWVLGGIISMLLVVVTGNILISPGPGLLIRNFDLKNPAHLFIASIDLFTVWFLAVLSIGFTRLARIPFLAAAAWLYGIWAVMKVAPFILTRGL